MKNKITLILSLLTLSPLVVLASPTTDRKIEDTAKESYNYRTILDGNVKVKAKDGIVTLTGTTQDDNDKALAADTVENIPGVTGVKNEIVVKSTYPQHSDAWIAFKIRSTLLMRANVSATNTQVSVSDGVVTLTGTADDIAQKELTEVYAKEMDWVKSVKNNLVIQPKPVADLTLGEKIDDASITSQVKYSLISHKATSALKTKVTTTDGIVVISGEAATDSEKSLVTKLVENIRGVKSVSNNMTVKE